MNTNDTISGISLIYPDATHIVIVTASGKFTKFNITGLPKSTRNKVGNNVIKLSKTDRIIAIYGVNDTNILSVTTSTGKEDIPIANIPVGSTVSSGIKLLQSNSNIIKAEIKPVEM